MSRHGILKEDGSFVDGSMKVEMRKMDLLVHNLIWTDF